MINKYAEIKDRLVLYNACKGILRVKQAAEMNMQQQPMQQGMQQQPMQQGMQQQPMQQGMQQPIQQPTQQPMQQGMQQPKQIMTKEQFLSANPDIKRRTWGEYAMNIGPGYLFNSSSRWLGGFGNANMKDRQEKAYSDYLQQFK